jgi:V/A-type H+-transporting ATPase subunit C
LRKKIKDTDYLAISARIRALETGLLTRERMEQVLEARSDEEAVKILRECGYPELDPSRPEVMDAALTAVREETLADLADSVPDPGYIDVFKVKYDYHNVKAILKAEAMNTDPAHMLMNMGRVDTGTLREALRSGDMQELPAALASAAEEARDVLETTRDPQLCDLVLDRWYYRDMDAVAQSTGSAFLQGYVTAQIDAANLRALVRSIRMGKNAEFLRGVLFEGGEIGVDAILKVSADHGSGMAELYGPTRFQEAAEVGSEILQGGAMTRFEKLCDDAVGEYLSGAQAVAFGEAPLLAYLAARETEYTTLRILLLGRAAGLPADVIRTRLRDSF